MLLDQVLRQMKGFRPRTIVHVGAHLAQEIGDYEALEPETCVWIEADPEIFARMGENIRARMGGRVNHHAVNALVTDEDDRTSTLRHFSNDGASSSVFASTALLRSTFAGVHETGRVVTTQSSRLDTILDDLRIPDDQPDILVLDIQGAELLALRGAARRLPQVMLLEVEISREALYEGAPTFEELEAHLRAQGFFPVTPAPWHGDMVFANSRFVNARPPE